MKDITVLITGAGAPGAPGIIKSLRLAKERRIKIVGADMNENAAGFGMVDKYYLVPPAQDPDFIRKVFSVARKEKVKVIIPLVTKELLKFARSRKKFGLSNIKVSVSSPEALKIANDKYLLMSHCLEQGMPVPKFKLVKNYKEFRRQIFAFGYPKTNVCFKPPVSMGMRGFRILTKKSDRFHLLFKEKPTSALTSLEELEPVLKNAKRFPPLIVMEYLPGEEYSADVLAQEGKVISVIPRLREKIKMGVSFVGTVVKDEEIIERSREITESLKLNGNIGFQFKRDKKGAPKIIECNPRVQGTIVLCTAAGANLVYLAVKLALGEKIKEPKIKWGTKMIRYWDEIFL